MANWQGFWAFFKTLRLEPILFIFCLASSSCKVAAGFLTNQKICFPDGPPGIKVICNDTHLLQDTAELNEVRGIIQAFVPAVLVIMAGSWRDVTHRTLPLIIVSHIGDLAAAGIELFSVLSWSVSPWITDLLSAAVGSLGGGSAVMMMSSVAYLTEQCTDEEKAIRISLVTISLMGGACISATVGGLILTSVGYPVFFIAVMVLFGISMVLACLFIWDRPTGLSGGYMESARRFKRIFKSRPNTFQIWSLMIATALITTMLAAEGTVSTQFLQKKFQMPPAEIGFLGGYRMFTALIATGITTPLLKKCCKISDFKIVAICVVPSVISSFGCAFAETLEHIYIFATFDILRITLISTLMHIFTGCIQRSEVGIFTSFLGFGEGLIPLGLNPLYVYVFNHTVDTLPGAYYCISGCSIISSAILVWVASCSYEVIIEDDDETPIYQEDCISNKEIDTADDVVTNGSPAIQNVTSEYTEISK